MKKKNFKNKLAINKRTVSNLDGEALNRIKGGTSGGATCESVCWSCNSCVPETCGPERTLESDCYCETQDLCWSDYC